MRKPLIAGNWKMNKTPYQAQMLVRQIDSIALDDAVEALVCVPAVDLQAVNEVMDDCQLHLGAQNMHYADNGAYTGEISAAMLIDLQVEYVILGHSERRELFGESDALIQKKVDAALAKGLLPILCVGETLEEREAGKQEDKVQGQLLSALQNVKPDDFDKVVIAYEPIWAIGTGKRLPMPMRKKWRRSFAVRSRQWFLPLPQKRFVFFTAVRLNRRTLRKSWNRRISTGRS